MIEINTKELVNQNELNLTFGRGFIEQRPFINKHRTHSRNRSIIYASQKDLTNNSCQFKQNSNLIKEKSYQIGENCIQSKEKSLIKEEISIQNKQKLQNKENFMQNKENLGPQNQIFCSNKEQRQQIKPLQQITNQIKNTIKNQDYQINESSCLKKQQSLIKMNQNQKKSSKNLIEQPKINKNSQENLKQIEKMKILFGQNKSSIKEELNFKNSFISHREISKSDNEIQQIQSYKIPLNQLMPKKPPVQKQNACIKNIIKHFRVRSASLRSENGESTKNVNTKMLDFFQNDEFNLTQKSSSLSNQIYNVHEEFTKEMKQECSKNNKDFPLIQQTKNTKNLQINLAQSQNFSSAKQISNEFLESDIVVLSSLKKQSSQKQFEMPKSPLLFDSASKPKRLFNFFESSKKKQIDTPKQQVKSPQLEINSVQSPKQQIQFPKVQCFTPKIQTNSSGIKKLDFKNTPEFKENKNLKYIEIALNKLHRIQSKKPSYQFFIRLLKINLKK